MKQDLARVKIVLGKRSAAFSTSFEQEYNLNDNDQILKELLELSDDWSSYCVSALSHMAPLAQMGKLVATEIVKSDLIPFLTDISIAREERDGAANGVTEYRYVLHPDDVHMVAGKLERAKSVVRASTALERSTLAGIIGEFEYFLNRFLSIVALHSPENFYDADEKVPLGFVLEKKDVESVRAAVIAKNIEEKLRDSHAEMVRWALKVSGLTSVAEKITGEHVFIDFLEVCQRRHILIHNGGIVNELYRNRCRSAGVKEKDLLPMGEKISVDRAYMRKAVSRAYQTGLYIIHMYIQKSFPQQKKLSFSNLLNCSHDFLLNGHTKMCARVCDFAEYSKKHMEHDLQLMFAVNRALSELLNPEKSYEEQTIAAKKVLSKYDWSSTSRDPLYRLVLSCIRREWDNLLSDAQAAYSSGLRYEEARTWAVFIEARKREGFLECFPRSLMPLPKPSNHSADLSTAPPSA